MCKICALHYAARSPISVLLFGQMACWQWWRKNITVDTRRPRRHGRNNDQTAELCEIMYTPWYFMNKHSIHQGKRNKCIDSIFMAQRHFIKMRLCGDTTRQEYLGSLWNVYHEVNNNFLWKESHWVCQSFKAWVSNYISIKMRMWPTLHSEL